MDESITLTPTLIASRLLLAGLVGAIIGYERRVHHKAIGISGMMLVAIGSATYMLLAQYLAGADSAALSRALQGLLQYNNIRLRVLCTPFGLPERRMMMFRILLAQVFALLLMLAPPATAASCVTSKASWQRASIPKQTGTFIVLLDATPNRDNMDGVIGFSSARPSTYSDLAAIVRFNSQGYIDAYNGTGYGYAGAPSSPYRYRAGTTYRFRFVINIPAQTYDVSVSDKGSGEQYAIAEGFKFRTRASSLRYWSLYAKSGTHTVCNLVVNPPSYQGTWFGTFQGGSVSFYVSNDNIVKDGFIQFNPPQCGSNYDFGPHFIIDNAFSWSGSGTTISGTFTSPTTMNGRYTVATAECTIDVPWSATRQ